MRINDKEIGPFFSDNYCDLSNNIDNITYDNIKEKIITRLLWNIINHYRFIINHYRSIL